MILPINQYVIVPQILLPPPCLISPVTNVQYIKPSCSGSFYFDPVANTCEGIQSMMANGFCTTEPTPYFATMKSCQSTCVPSRLVDTSQLELPTGKSWNTWTCKDKPCGSMMNCVDEFVQQSCFQDPCPQFQCFEPVLLNM